MAQCVTRLVILVVLTACFALPLMAQDVPKWEVGGQITALRLGTFGINVPDFENMPTGYGGRVVYNLTPRFSLEGELNVFTDQFDRNYSFFSGALQQRVARSRPIQGQFGVKYGLHFRRFGIFAKARPGFLHMTVKDYKTQGPGAPTVVADFFRTSGGYSVDLGGVMEIYPNKHMLFRIDAGDTIIRTRKRILDGPDGKPLDTLNLVTRTNNLQISLGVGVRF